MIGGFPKALVVALILIGGVIGLFVFTPPHRQCQSQIEMLQQMQKGKVFPSQGKVLARSPLVMQEIENCKMGNSPGACFELFSTLRKLTRDLYTIPLDCAEDIKGLGEIRASLREGILLLAQISWGEGLPDKTVGSIRQGWLESSDIALFCGLKDMYTRIYGKDDFDQFRLDIFAKLPGEEAVMEEGVCKNCEFRKTALQVLSAEEVWARSIFSARCELYR
jgi:hypothetical protein